MWSTFTPEARRAILAAQIEAEREGRAQVAPAHLLLAALDCSAAPYDESGTELQFAWRDGLNDDPADNDAGPASEDEDLLTETAAGRVLEALNASPQLVRLAVQSRLRAAAVAPNASMKKRGGGKIKLSAASKRALQCAADEARRLGFHHIGTEHLLLGVARARFASMPWYFAPAWPLRRLKFISEATLINLWRQTDPLHTVVAEVLAEFKLDLAALRLQAGAAISEDPALASWTAEVQRAIDRAQKEARATGAARVGAEHLWLGLLEEFDIAATVQSAGIEVEDLQKHLRAALLSDSETPGVSVRFTFEARRIFGLASRLSTAAGQNRITPLHLLATLAGATDAGQTSALDRAQKALSAEPASRAEAAIARALRAAGLPEDHLRRHLLDQTRSRVAELRGSDAVSRVTAIVAEHLNLAFEAVTAETPLLAADRSHLVTLDIFLHCAREFGITIGRDEVKSITTAGALANAVVAKIATKNQATPREPARSTFFEGCMGLLVYGLPFMVWLGLVILDPNWINQALVVVPVGIICTTPITAFGKKLSPQWRLALYFLGLMTLIVVALLF